MAHRTALIAAGSIAIVVFAAAVAVGANLGILNAADSQPVGKLSAAANAQPSVPPATTAPVAATTQGVTTALPQKYLIKNVAKVSVAATSSGLRLQDVTAKKGWKWALAQSNDAKLTITFKRHAQIYTFVAVLARRGAIAARVEHPITKAAPAAPSTQSTTQVVVASTSTIVKASSQTPHSSPSGHSEGGQDGGDQSDD
jgi:hypothetical protein